MDSRIEIDIPEITADLQDFMQKSLYLPQLLNMPYQTDTKDRLTKNIPNSRNFNELFDTIQIAYEYQNTFTQLGNLFGMRSSFQCLLQDLKQEAESYLEQHQTRMDYSI